MNVLQEIGSALNAAADKAGDSIVAIGGGRGSGIVLGEDQVLTNAHNLRGDTTRVTFADGRTVQGRVSGADTDGDLAVLEVETKGAPPLDWSESAAEIGQPVFSVVRTAGAGLRATTGFVSATARAFRGPRGRRVSGSIEHTAPLARGSSGGAILDEDGRLLGINTNRIGQGFYLALPADAETRARVDALAKGVVPNRVRLGVGLAPSHVAGRLRRSVGLDERDGLLVRSVEDQSVAETAGIKPGDLIEGIGGHAIADVDDLFDALEAVGSDETFEIKIVRGAEELTLAGKTASQEAGGKTKPAE